MIGLFNSSESQSPSLLPGLHQRKSKNKSPKNRKCLGSRFRKIIKLTNNNLRKNSLTCASVRGLPRILWKNRISNSLRCKPSNRAPISLSKNRCINVRTKKCFTKPKRWRKCRMRTRKISWLSTRKAVKLGWITSKWFPWPKRTQIIYQKQLRKSKKKQCCEPLNQTFLNERIAILTLATLGSNLLLFENDNSKTFLRSFKSY